jgi:type IX secretion system PorP/SprF family membrane protein
MKTKIIFQIIALAFITNALAQDVSFENTNQSLVYLNPSFAGSNGGFRIQNNYRNQWPNIPANYITYLTCADVYLKKINSGLAFKVLSDDQAKGTLKETQVGVSYAYYFSAIQGKLKIIPSIEASFVQLRLDPELTVGDMINPRMGIIWNNPFVTPKISKTYSDYNVGILVNYKDFFAGITVKHLTQPDVGLMGVLKLPMLYRIHSSYTKQLNDKTLLQFTVMYTVQNRLSNLQLGGNVILFKHLVVGVNYFYSDAVMINGGYRNNYFSMQVGYGVTVSKLAGNTAGIWQFSCAFSFVKQRDRTLLQNFETW